MRRLASLGVLLILALGLATSAVAIEVKLTYQRHPDRQQQFYPYGFCQIQATLDRPAGEWKLPTFVSDQVVYGLVRLGDREQLVVLDKKQKDDKFFTRLYFDANANRDLTDDPAIDGKMSGDPNFHNTEFPIVDTQVVVGGHSLPYAFQPRVYYFGQEPIKLKQQGQHIDSLQFQLSVACSYTGVLEIDGKSIQVGLGDTIGNGRFDDTAALLNQPRGLPQDSVIYARSDSIYLSTKPRLDYSDGHLLSKRLYVGGKLFDVAVSTVDNKLTLTPVEGELSTLKVPEEVERISLYQTDGNDSITAYQPHGRVLVPKGEYRLLNYQMLRTDDQGDRWRLSAQGTMAAAPIELKGRATTKLQLGEPFQPAVKALVMGGNQNEARLEFTLRGKAEERVTELQRIEGNKTKIAMSTQNASQPKEPTYRIMKADGEVISQGKFEYG